MRQQLLEPDIDAVREPAVRIQWAGKPVHADSAAAEAKLGDALCYRVRPGAAARSDIADPVLGAAPSLDEGRHLHETGRLAGNRKNQNVELRIAAHRAEVARIGGVEVPHRGPAPQHDRLEAALLHASAHQPPTPLAFAAGQPRQLQNLSHGSSTLILLDLRGIQDSRA